MILTTIFYGYGFSLYRQVGPALGLALAVGIFVLQVALSAAWLRRLRFGPMQWLWRWLSYGSEPGPKGTAANGR